MGAPFFCHPVLSSRRAAPVIAEMAAFPLIRSGTSLKNEDDETPNKPQHNPLRKEENL
jgi:hypothetical protein